MRFHPSARSRIHGAVSLLEAVAGHRQCRFRENSQGHGPRDGLLRPDTQRFDACHLLQGGYGLLPLLHDGGGPDDLQRCHSDVALEFEKSFSDVVLLPSEDMDLPLGERQQGIVEDYVECHTHSGNLPDGDDLRSRFASCPCTMRPRVSPQM